MDTKKRWARPVLARDQGMLYISLDELVSHDHPIRIVEAVLSKLDWSPWEEHCSDDRRGQAPIHPQLLAGSILYGLTHKIRSSRELEEGARERLDSRCFLEGRTPIEIFIRLLQVNTDTRPKIMKFQNQAKLDAFALAVIKALIGMRLF